MWNKQKKNFWNWFPDKKKKQKIAFFSSGRQKENEIKQIFKYLEPGIYLKLMLQNVLQRIILLFR